MSHLGCGFLRRTIQKDGNPWRRLLRIKEGKPQVSNASATNAVYHSLRGNLFRPANWHLGPRRAGRVAIVLPILPYRYKENHTSVSNFDVVTAEHQGSAAGSSGSDTGVDAVPSRLHPLIRPARDVVLSLALPTHQVVGKRVFRSTDAVSHSRQTLDRDSESGCPRPALGQ
jgi:hypothetical protein